MEFVKNFNLTNLFESFTNIYECKNLSGFKWCDNNSKCISDTELCNEETILIVVIEDEEKVKNFCIKHLSILLFVFTFSLITFTLYNKKKNKLKEIKMNEINYVKIDENKFEIV